MSSTWSQRCISSNLFYCTLPPTKGTVKQVTCFTTAYRRAFIGPSATLFCNFFLFFPIFVGLIGVLIVWISGMMAPKPRKSEIRAM